MTVTKRTRFEILRRDNHSCRYCGSMAPDVVLHVDHVIPVALGGSDEPDNLVAACKDCNSGKSSTSPAEAIVSDVSDKALALAEAFKAELTKEAENLRGAQEYCAQFAEHWNGWTYGEGKTVPLPADWRGTLAHWQKLSVPMEILVNAIDTAMVKRGLTKHDSEFRYMCGIVWRTLDAAQQRVIGQAEPAEQGPMIVECAYDYCESDAIRYPDDEDAAVCAGCEGSNMWQGGIEYGRSKGWKLRDEYAYASDHAARFIDRFALIERVVA